MKVLLDHNMPRHLAPLLLPHEAIPARRLGWDEVRNGVLMKLASEAGFHVIVTGDKRILRQYTNPPRPIGIVLVSRTERSIVCAHATEIVAAIERSTASSFELVRLPR